MSDQTIEQLLAQLTAQEKAQLCVGRDFWYLQGVARLGLPAIMLTDGPHGLRKQTGATDHIGLQASVPATCFPTASALAATWNRELLQRIGAALGAEALAEKVSVLLGPGVNIKRHPLGGRNFEYFSEDPYLAGEMATAWVRGVQGKGVGASLKHFAVNNHEHGRMTVDAIVDERTLREIYLPAFESTVRQSQPWTVMCAYNKLNGTYLAEHALMLTDLLQGEWGFRGVVVTDWGANNDRVAGLRAGQHVEMPSSGQANVDMILAALAGGELGMAELDRSVSRVLALILKARATLEGPAPEPVDHAAHHALAREAAEQAAVLLKNDGRLLPLAKRGNIAVLGALATDTRYQGSGSSQINPTRLEQPLQEIERLLGTQARVSFSPGYALKGELTQAGKTAALSAAAQADAVILFAGLTPELESEGFDRKHLDLPGPQLELIAALAPYYHKLVIVLQNGAPVSMPFVDRVPAILEAYLGGQAGASAIARLLFGEANPGGKLAESFPLSCADIASDAWFPGSIRQSQYREGIWVGYRYLDSCDVKPLFPFGHGLSYSTFEYSDLQIDDGLAAGAEFRFARGPLTVSFTLANSGPLDGYETAQLYVGQQNPGVPRPRRELRNFARVWLRAGECRTVTLELVERDFAYWCTRNRQWRADSGLYDISVGASSADIRLQQALTLNTAHRGPERDPALAPYFEPCSRHFPDDAFRALLGHDIPSPVATRPFHVNSVIGELQGTWLGRKLKAVLMREITSAMGDSTEVNELMLEAIIDDMPLRNVASMSAGKLSRKNLFRLIHALNGDWLKMLRAEPVPAR
jgi:beta-glucosidase